MTVLIAGAGIAGLTLGLTLHQIGVPFRIVEATQEIRPLGVGINLQPNAVRELFDLGLAPDLERIGVQTRQIGFYSKSGHLIWEEPRGRRAGYAWPQYSVHRGQLQVMLYQTLIARAGADCLRTGARAAGFSTGTDDAQLQLQGGETESGDLLIGADGIHSALRAQMYPDEGAPIWNGQVLWRATTQAPVYFGGGAMVMIGHDSLRLVSYPITDPDPRTGLATINWIAEKRFDPAIGWQREDWNRAADISDFIDDFSQWRFEWIDVPALIRGAQQVLEYPMVDRDPLPRWTEGRVTLMGDAAHPTYPVGSNGASQAIIDARVIGAKLLEHGLTPAALTAYESEMRPITTRVGLANRGSGPDAILQRVEELCGGQFDDISQVIPLQELQDHSDKYKALAGFSIEELNAKPPIIETGVRIS
ncbi:flavin-dependent oxidoreductase [Sedimentitalea nanhaiensis]|uniref:2-polyprenyl-6-methoxyphenol hydroxylase n=1 Tax=Sedimentitalea nanhaiensis TaxID=999627 RepID=A0A1I6XCK1_9RHOB|nr:flavin-dependent oxidoreductase [Sedimentitalea nanhaiensis]SFT35762.1 2-polyprenyl-6-methoxyphenol hydroxylase [Sedimentitalea nanhaiensis]